MLNAFLIYLMSIFKTATLLNFIETIFSPSTLKYLNFLKTERNSLFMMSSLGSKMTTVFVYGLQVINAVFYVGLSTK